MWKDHPDSAQNALSVCMTRRRYKRGTEALSFWEMSVLPGPDRPARNITVGGKEMKLGRCVDDMVKYPG